MPLVTLLLSSVSYKRVFACRTDIYCCSLITLSAWWNLLCMPTPCQIKYPEKPPIISLQAKQMCVYQQSGCAVVFSMWKLQLKEIGSEPGIKSTGCLWVVLPILFSCCVCLCLHFGKLNSLVCSWRTFHVSAGLPYYDYIKWYVQLNKLSFKPSCVHIPDQDIFWDLTWDFLFSPIANYGTIVLALSVFLMQYYVVFFVFFGYIRRLYTQPLGQRLQKLRKWVIVGQTRKLP